VADALDVTALGSWVREFARVVAAQRDELTELDSAIGDADHGTNMDRGMSAAVAAVDATPPVDPAALLKQVGMTMVSKVGGASGPLYGTLFLRMAGVAGAGALDAATFARALRAGLDGVVSRGKAEPGDKTMVDALGPACDALDAALAGGAPLGEALRSAAAAAERGRDATVPLLARKGRASYLGERSIGHQDPGATSTALLIGAAVTALAGVEA
jgi:dihydroxyacetone kinase-like protein